MAEPLEKRHGYPSVLTWLAMLHLNCALVTHGLENKFVISTAG
jgi:hypothetical protein